MTRDHAREVRNLLSDPGKLVQALGLTKGAKRAGWGMQIRCPAGTHADKDPSCSVRVAGDGTVAVRCHGCGYTADAIGLAAQCLGLNARTQFRELLAECAKLGGDHALADEITGGERKPNRKPIARPALAPEPPRTYPPEAEVSELWTISGAVNLDADASRTLAFRRIDPDAATRLDAVRVLDPRTHWTRLPGWARYRGQFWTATGHRLLVPVFDPRGRMRSVRAWRVVDGSSPKRLPPAGHLAAGLVMANPMAAAWLRREVCPVRLYVVEGEPDWLCASVTFGVGDAVVGIGSGSWTRDFADRVPRETEVIVSTHADDAGDKYAAHVLETLDDRCPAYRWRMVA